MLVVLADWVIEWAEVALPETSVSRDEGGWREVLPRLIDNDSFTEN